MSWAMSNRADPAAGKIADRHYNRQKIGARQFVPPGRCVVLMDRSVPALWVTSWPFPEYVQHQWAGAWVNSLFRSEGPGIASVMIREAIAATRAVWNPPPLGIITFVDPTKVKGTTVRGKRVFGYSYWRAGFRHVGFTKGGLWVWQMTPGFMPPPAAPVGMQERLFE